ncbi:porin [Bradyrhizobium sp. Arg237L]|uniref:porin n=1 Tax=Bradyrhizobium sp. Arg237L TaxID=3003352 RepID=UPI00249E4137|nr:porin [Bradyrhizobium sp. Arg237L]MDI4234135.1 porin [Bradyrhizobium sp. Arg237L]
MKRLWLGAIGVVSTACGVQAADLPVKAKAVEYVKVCSLYGAGFFYIPGTETCIKMGGYLRVDTTVNGGGGYNAPAWAGNAGQSNRLRNQYISRSRLDLSIDTRTATEYGVVRTLFDGVFQATTGDSIATGVFGLNFAFIQFAGFTFGKAVSQFDSPWWGYPGNATSFLLGGYDDATGINQVAYTASFGGGVTASVSLEDSAPYTQSQLANTSGGTPALYAQGVLGTASYGGTVVPDIIGQVRVDQAWGLFQASVAAHNIHAAYYGSTETSGHPSNAWGWAGQLALSIRNIPSGPGDTFNISVGYANGASRYVIGGVSPNSFAMYGGTSLPGAYQSIAFGGSGDAVFAGTSAATGTGLVKSNLWGVRGAFTHNWDPYFNTALFGSYSAARWGSAGAAVICNAAVRASISGVCNPDFNIAQVGMITRWTPVKNLTFSGEIMYMLLEQKHSGTITLPGTAPKPAGVYQLKNQDTVVGMLRVQRNF